MQIAFLIYEGLTALDIIGPYEVFNQIPGVDVRFVAKQPGSIRVDSGAFSIGVDHKLADVPRPDVFVVPGGIAGTFAAAKDPEILGWVREAHAGSRYSTSVCTGSLILGAAGLLKDSNATTHWAAKALLEQTGATYTEQRIAVADKIITAAAKKADFTRIDLGRRVRELRTEHGWSLDDASSRSGLSPSSLYKIEKNKMSPTFDALKKLANGFELSRNPADGRPWTVVVDRLRRVEHRSNLLAQRSTYLSY